MYYTNLAGLTTLLTTYLSLATPTFAHDRHHGNGKGNSHGHGGFKIEPLKLHDFWVPSANKPVQSILNLKRKPGAKPHNAKYLQALRRGNAVDGVYGSEEIDVTDTGTLRSSPSEVTVLTRLQA